ncbi:MAG: hypothetical protein G01um101472_194 [Parcubacteria group bacterium Gr01-1014_72]|nr:MAG: hypothetical protein G01um101472_194 [Parcubacteria group bacterium Gr01-1014_72]
MILLFLPFSYTWWHYSTGITDLLRVLGNVIWFLYNFFSIPLLLSTFLNPWRRLGEGRGQGLRGLFESALVNGIVRIVGILVRAVVIAFGTVTLALSVAASIFVFLLWLILPFIPIALLLYGLTLLLL